MTNRIITMFNQNKPNLTVTGVYKLTNSEYIVEAVETTVEKNYNDPFYKVDLTTGAVTNYLPTLELDKFIEAVEKRTIYKRR